jgi:PTH1 family peptidyl-tRNA hydrolase
VQRFYRVACERVIAVHDDVDLDVGRVRIRRGGRAGGNRGIASMIEALGDPEFLRVKVGVGRPLVGPVPPNYVLGFRPRTKPFGSPTARRAPPTRSSRSRGGRNAR